MQLRDRVALVTGAGSGIGRAAALLLAREGARVAVLSRTQAQLDSVVAEITAAGGEAVALRGDVGVEAQIEHAIAEVAARWGRLDILIANAGVNGVWAPIEQLALEEWEAALRINLTGTFLSIKYAVPYLKERGGSIVVTASINGTRVFSNSGATAYACSKAGQVALTKMLALELAAHRIRVNVICPGAIATEIADNTNKRNLAGLGVPTEFPRGWHPLAGAPGSAEQVAQLVLFLASDASNHITGTPIWIDGGESLIGING